MSPLDTERQSELMPGTQVEVLNGFQHSWSPGFEVAAVDQRGYRVRRRSDGAVLPVVMLALRLTLEKARWGLPLLASAYAALLLSHLPTALLCSLTVIPAYVLFATRSAALLLRCAAGGALGIGLAAIVLAVNAFAYARLVRRSRRPPALR